MDDQKRLLELAIKGLEAERQQIDSEIATFKEKLLKQTPRSANGVASKASKGGSRRELSATAREAISAAAKRRWAKYRKAAGVTSKKPDSELAKATLGARREVAKVTKPRKNTKATAPR